MPVLIWIACLIELIRISPLNLSFLLVLQLVNGLVWYIEKKNSDEALNTIRKSLAPKALVKRDYAWITIIATELVVGDRIQIRSGDLLPADCILGPGECLIDQSMLTGETAAINKIEGGVVYMGSLCKSGEIEANVTATGVDTYFGRTNLLSTEVEKKGKIQRVLGRIAFLLITVSVILVSVILLVFLVKGNQFLESLSSSVVLLVVALPIAMQAVLITTLAVGAKGMDKRKAVVCRLESIEELAGMQILCLHKSAIFTKDEPTVHNPELFQCKSIEDLFLFGFLASRRDTKNSVDRCICDYAIEMCKIQSEIYEEEDFSQYDPKIKKSEATVRNSKTGEVMKCSKGSPKVILEMTKEWELAGEVEKSVSRLALQGYSCIAIASTDHLLQWKFRGIIPIYDPFYEGVEEHIQQFAALNVKLIFLTGDQLEITKQISSNLRLGDVFFNADVLNTDTTAVQRELVDSILLNSDGFAEVFPEHKFTIVKMLQNKGKKIGITGSSVSDAAALKKADVGLAGFGATDTAMASAEIILHQPGLGIIISAVSRARKIFRRAMTYCVYRISCSFQLLSFFFISLMAVNPKQDFTCSGSSCQDVPNTFALPVLAIVLIALLNDIIIISISYDRASTSPMPCKWNLSKIFIISCTLGAISFFSSFIYLLLGLANMNQARPIEIFSYFGISTFTYGEVLTSVFLKVSISNYLTLFSVRTQKWFFLALPGNALMLTGMFAMISTTLMSRYWVLNIHPKNSVIVASLESISWGLIAFVWVFSVIIFVAQDVAKMLIYKAFNVQSAESDLVLNRLCLSEVTKAFQKDSRNMMNI